MKDKNIEIDKYFSETAATVIYIAGCICGIYVAYISYSENLSMFERIANGVLYPISYGFGFGFIYFILCFILACVVKDRLKQNTIILITTIIAVAAGLFVSLLR